MNELSREKARKQALDNVHPQNSDTFDGFLW